MESPRNKQNQLWKTSLWKNQEWERLFILNIQGHITITLPHPPQPWSSFLKGQHNPWHWLFLYSVSSPTTTTSPSLRGFSTLRISQRDGRHFTQRSLRNRQPDNLDKMLLTWWCAQANMGKSTCVQEGATDHEQPEARKAKKAGWQGPQKRALR